MRGKFNSMQRNYIIIGLCAILVIMGVGYAAFSSQLKITGTSNIDSTWSVKIISITPTDIIGEAKDKPEITDYTDTTATFGTSLKLPNDSITYNIVIENQGSLDAKLDTISKTDTNNSAISFVTSGVEEGDLLRAGENVTMKVKVTYTPGDEQPTNLESNLKVELNYSQAPNGYIPPVKGPTMGGQTVELVESGDGLYEDSTRAGRYVYKGANPNNYITFNNETWRIVAKEADGTYKIVRNELLSEEMPFDTRDYRDSGSNGAGGTYCANSSYGCNAWAANANLVGSPAEFTNTTQTGTVLLDSSLNTYLNGTYLSSITTNADKIVNYNWGVGAVGTEANYTDDNDYDAGEFVAEENAYQWNGKIALLSQSDALLATSNEELCGTGMGYVNNVETCGANNYLIIPAEYWWLVSPTSNDSTNVTNVRDARINDGDNANNSNGVRPALYLSSDITLSGSGTAGDPYRIN